jgi:ribosomal protein S6--L-glutamate ligase
MEVNSSPGLEGVEKATNKDIATKIIQFIEENAAGGNTRTKGRG